MKSVFQMCLFLVVFSSCTIQKRLYTGGYHIEFSKRYKSTKADNHWSLEHQQALILDSLPQEIVTISKHQNETDLDQPIFDNPLVNEEKQQKIEPIAKKQVLNGSVKKESPILPKIRQHAAYQSQSTYSLTLQKDRDDYWTSAFITFLEVVVVTGILVLCFVYPTFGVVFLFCLLIFVLLFLIYCIFSFIDGVFDFLENW